MPSFDEVNYSLRPNKHIQRTIVFDGLRSIKSELNLRNCIYIGFGSIWFTDFGLAHRILQVNDMISIEGDEIGIRRAQFNKPFKTVRIEPGHSNEVIPKLLLEQQLQGRPWVVWLDYDKSLQEESVDDIRSIVERAPQNSVLLVTLNASGGSIARAPESRPQRLRALLGPTVPDELSRDDCREDTLPETIAKLIQDFMVSVAVAAARPGSLVPAFRLIYRDGAPMVTVGGILPSRGAVSAARDVTQSAGWQGFPSARIVAPHLTIREAAALQSELPRTRSLSRKSVQKLGFDLKEEQIKSFEKYYRYYPSFAQITT